MDEKITCTNCGAIISAAAKFCPQCGEKKFMQKERSSQEIYCRYCGTPIQQTVPGMYCPQCGKPIELVEKENPASENINEVDTEEQSVESVIRQVSVLFTSEGRIGRKQFAIRLAISCACMSIFFILVGWMLDGGTAATVTAAGIILGMWCCFTFSHRLHTVYLQYKKWMWCFWGTVGILSVITGTIGHGKSKYAAVLTMLVLLLCVCMFFVCGIYNLLLGIRRCHDVNHSGWLILLLFIPVIGNIFSLYLLCAKGTAGPNSYGEDPLANSSCI